MEPDNKLLHREYKVNQIPFFLAFQESADLNLHPFLGYPMIPIIGRYGGGGYELNQTLFVATLPCIINDKKIECLENRLNLPERITQILRTIPQLIPHNKPPKKDKLKGQDLQQLDHGVQYHPLTFPILNDFKFRFIISTDQSKKPNQFMNYVNHPYIFKEFDFEQKKKIIHYLPCCLIPAEQSGVYQWARDYKSISFSKLRSEYMSFHIKKGAPAFSPNNMKIGLKEKINFLNFFTIVLTEEEYYVNYHWHIINKDQAKVIEKIVLQSTSLSHLIELYKKQIGNDALVRTLQSILF